MSRWRNAATRSTGSGQSVLTRAPRSGRRRIPSRGGAPTSSVVAAVSIENTISAASLLRPRDGHVRDVDASVAEHRADPPDHAGLVGVADEHHVRRDLHVDPKPSAPPRKRGSGPIVVPETAISSPSRAEPHLDRVRVVAGRAVALLDDLDPALGGDHGRVDDVVDDPGRRAPGTPLSAAAVSRRVSYSGEWPVRGDGDPLRAGRPRARRRSGRVGTRAG